MSVRETFPEGLQQLKAALETLNGGGYAYYTRAVDMLFDRFCPWKEGDRVVLTKAVDFDSSPGWSGCQHWLKPGAHGTVAAVDTRDGLFVAGVVFEDNSWLDLDGNPQPPSHPRQFWFTERSLVRVDW